MEIYRWRKWVHSVQSQAIIQLFPVPRSRRFYCQQYRSIEAVIPQLLRQMRKIESPAIAYESIAMLSMRVSMPMPCHWRNWVMRNNSRSSTNIITIIIELTRTATIQRRVKMKMTKASEANQPAPNSMRFRHRHLRIISKEWPANISCHIRAIICIHLALILCTRTSIRHQKRIINSRRHRQPIQSIRQPFRAAIPPAVAAASVAPVKNTSAAHRVNFASNWKHKIWHQ